MVFSERGADIMLIHDLLRYYLAFLICVITILMYLTIVFIPIAIWLKDHFEWFREPFEMARIGCWL